MASVSIEVKRRYWKKKLEAAPIVPCECGCGETTRSVDQYGRPKTFINGHNTRKYDDPQQHKREWNHRNREARAKYRTKYTYRLKAMLIAERGGACQDCGLKHDGINGSVFDFHHKPKCDKKFNLNLAALSRYGVATLRAESRKCELLCSNCHRLVHSAEY